MGSFSRIDLIECPMRTHLAPGIEEMLMLNLLTSQSHNYLDELQLEPKSIAPKHCRLAVRFIEEHLGDEITLADIALAANCSIRSLSRAFRDFIDTTPMRFLQTLRLQRVNAELSADICPQCTIAHIALHWGFGHLGEFNRQYRASFGESPSQTRLRARLRA